MPLPVWRQPLRGTRRGIAFGQPSGGSDAEMTINQAGNEESSSLLVMADRQTAAAPDTATIGQERVSVRRLDGIDLPQSSALMLKADVQGYEAEVLEGAAGILPTVRLVEFELSIVELYEGQPLLRDMLNLLAESGFELVLLEPGYQDPRDGTILQFDGIFQRSERPPSNSA